MLLERCKLLMINDEVNELDGISEDMKNEIRKEVTTNKLRIEIF